MTRREIVLSLLRQAGSRGVSTAEFLQGGAGSRYSARVLELREQGHRIDTTRIRPGAFRYTLALDAERAPVSVPEPDPLFDWARPGLWDVDEAA